MTHPLILEDPFLDQSFILKDTATRGKFMSIHGLKGGLMTLAFGLPLS
jgi:hypothetical protein